MSIALPPLEDLVRMLFVLNAAAVFAAAAAAWLQQLVVLPLARSVGRGGFPRYQRVVRGGAGLVFGPLLVGDILTSVLLVFAPHDSVTTIFVWSGAGLALLVMATTLTLLRAANRRLDRAFDVPAYRRVLMAGCLRANLLSMHAALVAVMLLR